jgi:hypothetical protein
MSPLVPYTEKGMNFSSPRPESGRDNLLYSVGTEIRLHLDGEKKEYLIKRRPRKVSGLAIWKGDVIDAGEYQEVISTETDEVMAECPTDITALAVRGDKIVTAGFYFEGNWLGSRIAYAETGERIADRRKTALSLAVLNGDLIDAGRYHEILRTENDERITARTAPISALAVRENELYFSECYRAGKETHSAIRDLSGNLIRIRNGFVECLAIYKGRLIDAGDYGWIKYSEGSQEPLVHVGARIGALLPINQEITDRLLSLKGVEEII